MIRLTDTLYLDADQHQYIIGNPRQRKGEAGERVELRNTTYHTTVASALSAALSRAMRTEVQSGAVTTLQEYLEGCCSDVLLLLA